MAAVKHQLHEQMSDFHETALQRYEEEQDQLYREEKEREENPEYWHTVKTKNWEDYAFTEEDALELIKEAKKEGLEYEYKKEIRE